MSRAANNLRWVGQWLRGCAVPPRSKPRRRRLALDVLEARELLAAVYRVNAGGPAIAGTPGWSADTAYVNSAGTKPWSTTAAINMTHASIPAGTPMALLQTERYDLPGDAPMQYAFPVTPGAYEVRLYFAEAYSGNFAVGKRVFDVSIENALVLDNYDIFAEVGARKGVVKSFLINSDATLNIDFSHVVENPAVKAIEILETNPPAPPAVLGLTGSGAFGVVVVGQTKTETLQLTHVGDAQSPPITLDPQAASLSGAGAGAFSVSFASSSPIVLAPGQSTSVSVTFAPSAPGETSATLALPHSGENSPLSVALSGSGEAAPAATLYRVNAGGPAIAGTPGWSADTAYVNSVGTKPWSTTAAINITHPSIPAGTPMALFQTERYDLPGDAPMQYAFPVTPGAYEVRLYFAEAYSGNFAVGKRVFDVSVENALVLDNYDIFAEVGAAKGVVKLFVVNSDATLNIDFSHVVENPAVKAIEILEAGSPAPSATLGATGNGAFGAVVVGQTKTQTLQLIHTGNAQSPSITLDPQAATITGAGASSFSVSFAGPVPIVLAPGQSTSVNVTFAPTATGGSAAALSLVHSGDNSPLVVPLSGDGVQQVPIGFGKSGLVGESSSLPTSLQFGPDGRLYVAQQNGLIKVYTIVRNGPNDYSASATETITLIQAIPNHNDNGVLNSAINTRLITGLLVAGTPQNPVIYVGSSDPRIGAGPSGTDLNLDTNSGILSRLTWNGSSWTKLDLVRGLPRSEENHASNGMQLDPVTNMLYLGQGGNTNMGATSNNFAYQPEYALTAAILAIDLDAIGNTTYDLPTLDDEDRPGVADANDPFGGNDGKNQAKLIPGGPVQVYAPGFRNPFDIVITEAGRMYTIDNGPNAGWGNVPIGEGPQGLATNEPNEPGVTYGDGLHYITGPGYYGGHPNPTRSNPANTFNASNPQSPVSAPNPIESDYRIPGVENGALVVYPASTNGLTEYTASNFGGALQGDLLAASFDNAIKRAKLNASGDGLVLSQTLFNSVGVTPLDITTQGDNGPFPGTIWVADIAKNDIIVFEPNDYDGGSGGGEDPDDLDGDGYSNDDEIANGTNPQSAGDTPPDWDEDFLSNLLDDDDDNDGLPDDSDPFAIDPQNGTTTPVGVSYTWENDADNPGGLLGLGFTGLMANGASDYEALFDPALLTAGGAAGVLTIDQVSDGTADGALNTQEQAFQFGVNAATETEPFVAHTRVLAPFSGILPQAGQALGLFVGNGDQDNFLRIVLTADGGGAIASYAEVAASPAGGASQPIDLASLTAVDFYLRIDPANQTIQPSYALWTEAGRGPRQNLGVPWTLPADWISTQRGLAVGIISTSAGPAPVFPATWDFLEVVPDQGGVLQATPAAGTWGSVAVGQSVPQLLQLTNLGVTGDPTITVQSVSLTGPDSAQFTLAPWTSVTLQPGESTTVAAAFQPTTTGPKSAAVQIVHNGVSAPLNLPLSGLAVPATTSQALFKIDPPGDIKASTYTSGSFILENTSPQGQKINSLRLDLSTALFPDLVFDPQGQAGDIVAKGFTVNNATGITVVGHSFSGAHDGGYDVLEVQFSGFDPGEKLTFSIDIDPTSIRGTNSPGPNDSGSVSGLELTGATVTVQFSDGAALSSQTYRIPASDSGSQAMLHSVLPPAPAIEMLGLSNPPAVVNSAAQTVRVSGPAGATVALVQLEGGLYTAGLPGGGFDLDPFEANSVVAFHEYAAVIGPAGFVDVPVTLTKTDAAAGVNHFAAVLKSEGRTGPLSPTLVVQYDDSTPPANSAPVIAPINDQAISEGGQLTLPVSATDPDGHALTLQASGLPAFATWTPTGNGQANLTFAPAAGHAGSYPIQITAQDAGSPPLSDVESFTLVVSAVSSGGAIVYRVNAGGPALSGDPGWMTDAPYLAGGPTESYSKSLNINLSHPSIPAGTPMALFQTERWDAPTDSEMQWNFPVEPGLYEVRLYFAEIYYGAYAVGARVFDVYLENNLVLDNYDIYAEVGATKAVMKSFLVASDGNLDLDFGHVVQNPAIKAIEIIKP